MITEDPTALATAPAMITATDDDFMAALHESRRPTAEEQAAHDKAERDRIGPDEVARRDRRDRDVDGKLALAERRDGLTLAVQRIMRRANAYTAAGDRAARMRGRRPVTDTVAQVREAVLTALDDWCALVSE